MTKNTDVLQLFEQAGPLFVALGEENRQHIVAQLLQSPELSVNEIASASQLSRPAISHHLKVLQQAHILSVSKRGTQRMYHLSDQAIHQIDLLEALARALRDCTKWYE